MAVDWSRDEIILACDLVRENGWRGLRAHQQHVRDLSDLLIRASIHPQDVRDPAFRSPNSVQRKTFDIATQDPEYAGKPTRGNKLDGIVLTEFIAEPERMRRVAAAIRASIASDQFLTPLTEEIEGTEMEVQEGVILLSKHLIRERDPRLRSEKLKQVTQGGGRPACEVCSFDFEHVYGEVGRGYIEVHHRLPLHASGPTTTRLRDLVLLCSNCHRMIHRSKQWLTPEELRHRLSGSPSESKDDSALANDGS